MYTPPARFAGSTFDTYRAHQEQPSQVHALTETRHFVHYIREQQLRTKKLLRHIRLMHRPRWMGLYLVGPVGTGKTHLLSAMYHALHPLVPCAFIHSSSLFRATAHPNEYAKEIASRYRVLCIDEVELDDPGNAARFSLVLDALNKRGIFILATSNVKPEKFALSGYENEEFYRMLTEEFKRNYRVLFLGGDDYRQRQPRSGRAWIGPGASARDAMMASFEAAAGKKRWFTFKEVLHFATEMERTRLDRKLSRYDRLYIDDVEISGTDDALRLLRILDDLYFAPSPPVLFFTSETPPAQWFSVADARGGTSKGVAEKFLRATSRLSAMCEITYVDGAHAKGVTGASLLT